MSCALSETASVLLKSCYTRSAPLRSYFPSIHHNVVGSRASVRNDALQRRQTLMLRLSTASSSSGAFKSLIPYGQACAFHTSSARFARRPSRRHELPEQRRITPGRSPRHFIRSVDKEELLKIFDCEISENEGNKILRTLHQRRVEGSLLDRGVQLDTESSIPSESLMKALNYLRDKYPVDEQGAAQIWARNETAKLEESYIARAEKLGLYKPLKSEKVSEDPEAKNVDTGRSVIEEFKRYHAERRAKEAEEKIASGEAAREQELTLTKQVEKDLQKKKMDAIIQQRRDHNQREGQVSKMQSIPDMTRAQRLLPSTIFGCVLLVLYYFGAELYTPPTTPERLLPDIPSSIATVGAFISVNFFVYVLWKRPGMWRILNKYFTVAPAWPFAFSILGNTISHQTLRHLGANMLGLVFYGIVLHEDIGRGNWVALYLAGGAFGSLFSLWYCVLANKLYTMHYGASGALWAIMSAWAYLTYHKPPKDTESWDFLFDVCRWAVLAIQALGHFTPAIMTRVDVPAHAAGALMGLVSAWQLKRKAERNRPQESKASE